MRVHGAVGAERTADAVATLMLILAYPNIYRVKVELGLTDEEMKSLYGDQYIAEESKS